MAESKLFREDMTRSEAQMAYWTACAGKSWEEKERIRAEYTPVLKQIMNREFAQWKLQEARGEWWLD